MSATSGSAYDSPQTYINNADWTYPSKENISMFGPVLLPKIYGSNLSELEVASDGQIVLTVDSTRSLVIDAKPDDFLDIKGENKKLNLTSTLSVINLADATTLGDTLSVTSATVLSSTLSVSGATVLGNTLSVTSATVLSNTLSVGQATKLTGATTLGSTLSVTDATVLGSTLSVTAATVLGSTLSVSSATVLDDTLSVSDATVLNATLSVNDSAEFSSNVNVVGPKFTIPRGTENNRPLHTDANNKGSLYYNTELDRFEGLFKTGTTHTWNTLGGVIDNDQDTKILAQDGNTDTDRLDFYANGTTVMQIDEDSLTFGSATQGTGSNVTLYADTVSARAALTVQKTMSTESNLIVVQETELRSTLSVTSDAYFKSDIRMKENDGVLLLPQYTTNTYTNTTGINAKQIAANEGSIIYDTQQGIFMGLSQPDGGELDWRPIGGGSISDADGDTSITAESTFGQDEDTLTFTTSSVEVATMSNDKIQIKTNLSVNSPVNMTQSLDVNGNTTLGTAGQTNTLQVNGSTTITNTLTANGNTLLGSTLSVTGESTFGNNVSISPGRKIYTDTALVDVLGSREGYNELGEGWGGDLNMYYENVTIHGNLDIQGSINQSSTQVDELFIEDKSIVLGTKDAIRVSSNVDGQFVLETSNYAVKESDMSHAGITVSGLPDFIVNDTALQELHSNDLRFEKSILWKSPNVGDEMGTSNLALVSSDDSLKQNEPFWDIRGGHLRLTTITSPTQESQFVSFAFRINSKEQLELVKIVPPESSSGSQDPQFKTIAKFGSVQSS